MSCEHPFASYIRTLGKGRHGSRALTQEEARHAMQAITRYEVEPEQVGAFMALLRVKEETAEEIAGFVQGLRPSLALPSTTPAASIDWPSYAGKRRHLPWYLLAALALSRNGLPVFMHGLSREDGRLYAPAALSALGIEPCTSLTEASTRIETEGFAYLPVEKLSTLTQQLINMRQLLGLRTPMHTVARLLNPFSAPLTVQGVFHPNYALTHQQAARLLGQPLSLAVKGEGGEMERIAERPCRLLGQSIGTCWEEEWPALLPAGRYDEDTLNLAHLRAVWEGREQDRYGEIAVIGTLALVARALGQATDHHEAQQLATHWWNNRLRQRLSA